ncbi:MAG TPA: DUF1080 domain-containing protein [Bacteroidetes bacterium]|nr:DUF1080 domain-containing protein [Bacteroidota bacterium]
MKRTFFGRLLPGMTGWLILCAAVEGPAVDDNTLPDEKNGWVSMFNGVNLDGWRQAGEGSWYAEKGELVGESLSGRAPGFLCTREHFIDFELSLEFFPEEESAAGIFFRSATDGKDIMGWQAVLATSPEDTSGILETHGRGWLETLPPRRKIYPVPGKWNQFRLKVKKNRVKVWLNGKRMISLKDGRIEKGRGSIALQVCRTSNGKIKYRHIRIKTLDK